MNKQPTFHIIANAHLDPVWFWDRYEGLQEGLSTARCMLDLMDEFPEMTFIRGEAFTYEYIERHDPATFARIKAQIAAGRWDVVGGTMLQCDTNMPSTETFCRHYADGLRYMRERLGVRPTIAWFADSFGHTGGLPEILTQCGMTGFAFTRPFQQQMHLDLPVFRWVGESGASVTAYRPEFGWYGAERDEVKARLDQTLDFATKHPALENYAVFIGLGNHGGGVAREQILTIREWAAAHPEVRVEWSGLHRLFAAIEAENKAKGGTLLKAHRGEMNFTLRGCYASTARYKFIYRRAEAARTVAESTVAAVSSKIALSQTPCFKDAVDGIQFGSFHDLLPGTSIESAVHNQMQWMDGARHTFDDAARAALVDLSMRIDTRRHKEPPQFHPGTTVHMVWNPNPWPVKTTIELESCLDARPIGQYENRRDEVPLIVRDDKGRAQNFQELPTDNLCWWPRPWRKHVVLRASIPALGWRLFELGWDEKAPAHTDTKSPVKALSANAITNGFYTVSAKKGAGGVTITDANGNALFGKKGLTLVTVSDPHGSWGGSDIKKDHIDLQDVTDRWRVTDVSVRESGPERAALAVRLDGGASRITLMFRLSADDPNVRVAARLILNERKTRVKLVLPVKGTHAAYDVPGAVVTRKPAGEVPGGRWVEVKGGAAPFGFASDALYCFNQHKDRLEATIARAAFYSADGGHPSPEKEREMDFRPVTDIGELAFNFLLTQDVGTLPRLARELECPLAAFPVTASEGDLPRSGTVGTLTPKSLIPVALKPAADGNGVILRVQEQSGKKANAATFEFNGTKYALGPIPALGIRTFRITGAVPESVTLDEQAL